MCMDLDMCEVRSCSATDVYTCSLAESWLLFLTFSQCQLSLECVYLQTKVFTVCVRQVCFVSVWVLCVCVWGGGVCIYVFGHKCILCVCLCAQRSSLWRQLCEEELCRCVVTLGIGKVGQAGNSGTLKLMRVFEAVGESVS